MKIIINKCYGGFGLSIAAQNLYAEKSGFKLWFYKQKEYKHQGGKDLYVRDDGMGSYNHAVKKDLGDSCEKLPANEYWYYGDIGRADPLLVEVVEEIGEEKASGDLAKLRIVEIPDGIEYEIDDYDGMESIHEHHQTWG